MVFAVTVMDDGALLPPSDVDAVVEPAVAALAVAAVAVAAEVARVAAAGFSADVVGVAPGVALVEAADFSVMVAVVVVGGIAAVWVVGGLLLAARAAGVMGAGGIAAVWVVVGLLLAAGVAGGDADVAGLSSAIALVDDRKRGPPASCDDGCDCAAVAPFTSVASTSSSSQSDHASFLPVG